MANDGGYANAGPYDNQPGWSVRDEFAKAIVKNSHITQEGSDAMTHWIYDFAQTLTDEKLRRDKADKSDRQSVSHDCCGTGCSRIWSDRGRGPYIRFTATSDDLHCELCERAAQTIYVCTRCQCIICHGCFVKEKHARSTADRDEGTKG